ncbi:hypothetical protein E4U41_004003, partial [Claviceps citrina]
SLWLPPQARSSHSMETEPHHHQLTPKRARIHARQSLSGRGPDPPTANTNTNTGAGGPRPSHRNNSSQTDLPPLHAASLAPSPEA